jgi:hypothetical protein
MATNSILQPQYIARETLDILTNNLVAASKVNRQFEPSFNKQGNTITVRKPNKFTVTNGAGLVIQDITEPSTTLTLSQQAQTSFTFSSQELTLTIEEFAERYLKPAAERLANYIDQQVLANWNQVFNEVGTPGTLPSSFTAITPVAQRMDEGGVPQDGRTLCLGPAAYWAVVGGIATAQILAQRATEPALKGFLINLASLDIYLDQNVGIQTVGAYAGSGAVNGAGQTGSSLVTNGWTASITGMLNVGDVFTIGSGSTGVFAVNPQTQQSTGQLQNFVVTAVANSDSGGNSTIQIYPSITTTGAYQTVTASPANGATITVKGAASTSYVQNLAFHRDAIALVTAQLELPEGVDFAARETYRNISMRIVRQYDINQDTFPCRVDVLFGTSAFYPELAVRLTN